MPGMFNTVVQAAALSAFSNVLAQMITAYQEKVRLFNASKMRFRPIVLFSQMKLNVHRPSIADYS